MGSQAKNGKERVFGTYGKSGNEIVQVGIHPGVPEHVQAPEIGILSPVLEVQPNIVSSRGGVGRALPDFEGQRRSVVYYAPERGIGVARSCHGEETDEGFVRGA